MRCLRNVAAGLACGLAVLVSSLSPAAGQSLTWTGAVSNAWDIQTTQNWLNSSGTQTYSDGSDVTFGDGTANPSIAITAGGVSPASVTFTNNTTPYTFSGGPINDVTGGTTAVTLNGSGSVTFSGTNTYTGGTTINAGSLVAASPGAVGTGPIVLSGGVLQVNGTPLGLAHRWSFNNSLADSVGGSSATVFGSTTLSANQVTLTSAGGHQDAYVSLGTNILPTTNSPVTIELWATQNAVQNWSRIFDFGNGTGNNILMAWTGGTTITNDQLRYQAANGANSQENNQLAPYTLGTEYHIAVVITPYTDPTAGASTTFTAYKMDALGNVLNTATFNDPARAWRAWSRPTCGWASQNMAPIPPPAPATTNFVSGIRPSPSSSSWQIRSPGPTPILTGFTTTRSPSRRRQVLAFLTGWRPSPVLPWYCACTSAAATQ